MNKPTDRLQWSREATTGGDAILLKGVIDEHSSSVLAEARGAVGPKVVFDLSGVRRINSLGVRAWIQFVKSLTGSDVAYRRCTPPIVEQLNALVDFRGHARVESVLAPYLCEKCGEVRFEEIRVGADVAVGREVTDAPPRSCGKCQSSMQFDDLPDRYFQFLTYDKARG